MGVVWGWGRDFGCGVGEGEGGGCGVREGWRMYLRGRGRVEGVIG